MIPESVIRLIQDRVDIVEVIGSVVPLRRAGRNFKAPCPFHPEKTPSFMVSPDKQIFHCFGCGAGGDVIGFVMKFEKKDFREAVESLADRAGVEIPRDSREDPKVAERRALFAKANGLAAEFYHRTLLTDRGAQGARDYLKRRGLSEATISEFKIGVAPEAWDAFYRIASKQVPEEILERAGLLIRRKEGGFYDRFRNRIMFPIHDNRGECVAFGGRVLDDSLPKYLNSPETEIYTKGRHLYGLYQAKRAVREADRIFIVEGYMDLVSCHQAGVREVAASLGTALTTDQARLIRRHTKNVFILYDSDRAGEMATQRGLEICLEEDLEVRIVRLPEGHDPDSFIKEFGTERFQQETAKSRSLFEYKLDVLKKIHDAQTIEGRVRIANDFVPIFAKVKNEILKSAWVRELARELSLPESALLSEAERKAIPSKAGPVATPAGVSILRPVERWLLGLLFEQPMLLDVARQEVLPEDFENAVARRIVERLFSFKAGETVKAGHWISAFREEPDAMETISRACAEAENVAEKEKVFGDCVSQLKKGRLDRQRRRFMDELGVAHREGDQSRIAKILAHLDDLNRQERQLKKATP